MRLACTTLAALALLLPLALAFSGLGHDLKRQTCAWSFDEDKGNGPCTHPDRAWHLYCLLSSFVAASPFIFQITRMHAHATRPTANWGTICNGAYPICASGQQQSPIDVITANDVERPLSKRKITVHYPELVEAEFENTGYTLVRHSGDFLESSIRLDKSRQLSRLGGSKRLDPERLRSASGAVLIHIHTDPLPVVYHISCFLLYVCTLNRAHRRC